MRPVAAGISVPKTAVGLLSRKMAPVVEVVCVSLSCGSKMLQTVWGCNYPSARNTTVDDVLRFAEIGSCG